MPGTAIKLVQVPRNDCRLASGSGTRFDALAHALDEALARARRRAGEPESTPACGAGGQPNFARDGVRLRQTSKGVMSLLLLGHLPGDFCHQPGAKVGEHAVDDAGDVGWVFG